MLGLCFLAWRGALVLFESRRWPEPKVQPFWCARCNRGFSTGNVLSMHLTAQHDQRYGPIKERLDALAVKRKKPARKKGHLKLLR